MPKENDSSRKLLFGSLLVVVGHFLVVIWHLLMLIRIQPGFPALALVLLITVNLFPLAGVAAFAKGWPKLAAVMIVIPLGVALVAGGYTHFVSAGADNVFRLPPGNLRSPFQISAMLLIILESLGCGVGLRMLISGGRRSATPVSSR